jgi:hypothetical protein
VDAVKRAIELFCRGERRLSPRVIERFAPDNFRKRLHALIEDVMQPEFSRWADAPPPAPALPLLRVAGGAR